MKKIYLEGAHLEDIIRCKEDVAMKVRNVKWKKEMERQDQREEEEITWWEMWLKDQKKKRAQYF